MKYGQINHIRDCPLTDRSTTYKTLFIRSFTGHLTEKIEPWRKATNQVMAYDNNGNYYYNQKKLSNGIPKPSFGFTPNAFESKVLICQVHKKCRFIISNLDELSPYKKISQHVDERD